MRKLIFLILIFLNTCPIQCQKNDPHYHLASKSSTIGLTSISLTDPYLSPMRYEGSGVSYLYKRSQYLHTSDTLWSWQNKVFIDVAFLNNPTNTATMNYMAFAYDWGMYYHILPQKPLRLLLGGTWDINMGVRNIPRNINNPANMDLSTNLNMAAMAAYNAYWFKRDLQFLLSLETPLIGYMFVPEGGASYYEIFELNNTKNTTHFSSLFNKRGLRSSLSVDIPFQKLTCRLGVAYHKLGYKANDQTTTLSEFTFQFGTSMNIATFSGKKHHHYPKNFTGPDL